MKVIDTNYIKQSWQIFWDNKLVLVGITFLMMLVSFTVNFLFTYIKHSLETNGAMLLLALTGFIANLLIQLAYFIMIFAVIFALDKKIAVSMDLLKNVLRKRFFRTFLSFIAFFGLGFLAAMPIGFLLTVMEKVVGVNAVLIILAIILLVVWMVIAFRFSYSVYYALYSSHKFKSWFTLSWQITRGHVIQIFLNSLLVLLPGIIVSILMHGLIGDKLAGMDIADIIMQLFLLPYWILQYLYFKELSRGTGTEIESVK